MKEARKGESLRLIGLSASDIDKDGFQQMSLFGETENLNNERDEKLDKTLDSIRSRYGSSIVQRGTVMKSGLNVARKFKGEKDNP